MRFTLFTILLSISAFTSAQQTYVPDDNFETYLENNGMGNGIPGDDYVTTANISGVGMLVVWGWNIADLTGIEDFSALNTLYCFDNQLTSLNVTQNPNLSDLRCYNNQLTSLDVSQNPNLSLLFCDVNQISSLDVTQNPNLSDLRCFYNLLTTLDVSQNPNLGTLICYNNQLSSINLTNASSLSNFRCYNNLLSTIDVSDCNALSTLFCYNNVLTSLDVTQNDNLELLFCYTNQLTDLDVSQNTAMTDLRCYNNQLTSLDVSQNPALITLLCSNNDLTCLNAHNGQDVSMDCSGNQLSCISVTNPTWAYANAIYDVGDMFQAQCQTVIDNDVVQFETTLTAVQNGATYQWINCDQPDGFIIGATGQSYTPTETGYYAVEITYNDPCAGTYMDTSSCHYVDYSSIDELFIGTAQLVKITDLMGRDTPFKPNTPLIYIYDNGAVIRVFEME